VFVDADIECAPAYLENLVVPIARDGATGAFSKVYIGNL
jgi:hypothetical protein